MLERYKQRGWFGRDIVLKVDMHADATGWSPVNSFLTTNHFELTGKYKEIAREAREIEQDMVNCL